MTQFSDYVASIKALGRDISPELLKATRALVKPLLPGNMLDGVRVKRDISYGSHERQRLDVFTATDSKEPRPVLLFVHGGGFIAGDKHTEGEPFYSNIGAWAARNGFAGVNMTYRLAPDSPWPAGIEDIRGAVEWIQEQGAEHGLDATNIFLMGQSAGAAHAAGYLSCPEIYGATIKKPDHGLKAAILLSGVYDFDAMPTSPMEEAYLGEDESLYEERSALPKLMYVDIPLLVTIAEFDPPQFQAQGLQLLNEWWQHCEGDETWPSFIYLLGQNHLSPALFLGLEGDMLAPQLKRFIEENT